MDRSVRYTVKKYINAFSLRWWNYSISQTLQDIFYNVHLFVSKKKYYFSYKSLLLLLNYVKKSFHMIIHMYLRVYMCTFYLVLSMQSRRVVRFIKNIKWWRNILIVEGGWVILLIYTMKKNCNPIKIKLPKYVCLPTFYLYDVQEKM